jgi:hypothetical protein
MNVYIVYNLLIVVVVVVVGPSALAFAAVDARKLTKIQEKSKVWEPFFKAHPTQHSCVSSGVARFPASK